MISEIIFISNKFKNIYDFTDIHLEEIRMILDDSGSYSYKEVHEEYELELKRQLRINKLNRIIE